METVSLDKIESKHIFCEIYGLPQLWEEGESWSFLEVPRKDSGFMFILCDEIVIRFPYKREMKFHRGDLLYIPKYARYHVQFFGRHSDEYSDLLVNFDIRDFSGKEYTLDTEITCIAEHPHFSSTDDIFIDMYNICKYTQNMKYPTMKVSEAFYALLGRILSFRIRSDLNSRSGGMIPHALLYIDNHIGDNVTVAELAGMCLLSESAFRKAFRAYTGVSPAQYKITAKINKAKSILARSPEVSIAEVSESLGFYDVSYFYKTFAALTGKTPNQYRKDAEKDGVPET